MIQQTFFEKYYFGITMIKVGNIILLCMAKREDWTSFGISGSGKSRKNSLSNVATSCTPVSIERVICPPRSNSSLN